MTNSEGNAGWADAMNKILVVKKPKKNKTIILSKGKKLSLMKKKDGSENNTNSTKSSSIKKNDFYMKARAKPDVLDREKERKLQKITVKGVVKLFNAVNKHQQQVKDVPEASGPVITKKEKVMNTVSKSSFLKYLMGEEIKEELSENTKEMEVKVEGEEGEEIEKEQTSTWEVLQSNYGIGVKMKDWDKKGLDS